MSFDYHVSVICPAVHLRVLYMSLPGVFHVALIWLGFELRMPSWWFLFDIAPRVSCNAFQLTLRCGLVSATLAVVVPTHYTGFVDRLLQHR
jgi:hypothetical protein